MGERDIALVRDTYVYHPKESKQRQLGGNVGPFDRRLPLCFDPDTVKRFVHQRGTYSVEGDGQFFDTNLFLFSTYYLSSVK